VAIDKYKFSFFKTFIHTGYSKNGHHLTFEKVVILREKRLMSKSPKLSFLEGGGYRHVSAPHDANPNESTDWRRACVRIAGAPED